MEPHQLNRPRTEGMRPNDQLVEDLQKEVQDLQEDESKRTYHWLEQCNISFWDFRNKNPALMKSLEIELDISQWDDVAAHLGLSYQQIEHCRKCHQGSFTREVFVTLKEYPQYQDLTLKDFLEILLQHKRYDILLKLEKYACLGIEQCTTKTFDLSIQRQKEVMVQATNIGYTESKPSQFRTKVLVIHAHDAREDALQLASQLRNPVGSRKLYVLLLQESHNEKVSNSLRVDPWNSIMKWFMQVDVVVPVLSPLFLRQIQNRDLDMERGWEKRYNRFVYSMMLDQYVEHGARNYACRAVCPARFQREVRNNALVKHNGLLRVHWNSSSEEEVEKCAQILQSGAKEFRELKRKWKEELIQTECENEMTVKREISVAE